MNQLQIFNFEQNEVRTLVIDGIAYFVGKDVTDVLGYVNSSKALNDHVDNEDKLNNESLSSLGQRGGWLINESGLYSLILSSKMSNAKSFKRWVTSEVLPSIRKTGTYSVASNPMFEATELIQEEVSQVSERVLTLEKDTLLSSSEYNYIEKQLNRQGMEFVSVKGLEGNNDAKKLLFKDINTGIHAITGIRIRAQLRNRHFSDVVNYIRDWIPSHSTLILIEKLTDRQEA